MAIDSEYTLDEATKRLARKRQLARLLQEQSMKSMQLANPHARASWANALVPLAQAWAGKSVGEEAETEGKALEQAGFEQLLKQFSDEEEAPPAVPPPETPPPEVPPQPPPNIADPARNPMAQLLAGQQGPPSLGEQMLADQGTVPTIGDLAPPAGAGGPLPSLVPQPLGAAVDQMGPPAPPPPSPLVPQPPEAVMGPPAPESGPPAPPLVPQPLGTAVAPPLVPQPPGAAVAPTARRPDPQRAAIRQAIQVAQTGGPMGRVIAAEMLKHAYTKPQSEWVPVGGDLFNTRTQEFKTGPTTTAKTAETAVLHRQNQIKEAENLAEKIRANKANEEERNRYHSLIYALRSDQNAQRTAAKAGGVTEASGDFSKKGDEFLATVDESDRELVKKIAAGEIPITTFSTKGGHRENLAKMATAYDPSFNVTRSAVWKDFTSGPTGRNITSINTAIGHMGTMKRLAEAMRTGDVKVGNQIVNWVRQQTGDPKVVNYETAQQAVSEEMMRTFRVVGASEREAADWQKKFNPAGSPAQLQGAISTAGELLNGRIKAVNDQWKRGAQTDRDFPGLISEENQGVLKSIGVKTVGADKGAAAKGPKAGDVEGGYRFKGGDPSKKENWEKV